MLQSDFLSSQVLLMDVLNPQVKYLVACTSVSRQVLRDSIGFLKDKVVLLLRAILKEQLFGKVY